MRERELVIKQIDRQLENFQIARKQGRPQQGWIKIIRKALGMTAEQLAKRLSVSRMRVVIIEQAESQGRITLKTLKEVANALECELVYGLVPKESLENILADRAKNIASEMIKDAEHSMSLENQGVDKNVQEELQKDLIDSLRRGSLKHLWEK